jgi:hypothetical protein
MSFGGKEAKRKMPPKRPEPQFVARTTARIDMKEEEEK